MREVEELLKRQAEWQQSRARLSWSEKLRLAEILRDAAKTLRPKNIKKAADEE